MKRLMILLAVTAATSPLWAIQGTIRTATDSKKGDIKWQPRSKSYAVSFKKGNTMVSAEYPLADVEELDIEKPAGYDKAVENVRRGNGAASIGVLSKVVQDYKMLKWDKPAGRYLVEAYISANNAQKALEVAEGVIKDDKSAEWKGELAPAYWQALLKLGKTQKLEGLVKKAAISGDRAASANALVMRGDMIPGRAHVRRRAVPRGACRRDAARGRLFRQARPGRPCGAASLSGPQTLTTQPHNHQTT